MSILSKLVKAMKGPSLVGGKHHAKKRKGAKRRKR